MIGVHIRCARAQPATNFFDDSLDPPTNITRPDGALVWCECCTRRRLAKNATVRVYYDHISYWCADGKGCKAEAYVEARRRREFRNRSRAAKAAWIKRRAA